jgi:hypothetical protein
LFFLWAAGIRVIEVLLNDSSSLTVKEHPVVGGLIGGILGILEVIALVHLAMIFPAVATEVPSESWQARVGNSWKQMKGHAWLLVRAGIVAFLPWILLYVVFWILFGGLRASQHHGDLQHSWRLGLALLVGGAQIFLVMLGAALASWLYAWVRQKPGQSVASAVEIMPLS